MESANVRKMSAKHLKAPKNTTWLIRRYQLSVICKSLEFRNSAIQTALNLDNIPGKARMLKPSLQKQLFKTTVPIQRESIKFLELLLNL